MSRFLDLVSKPARDMAGYLPTPSPGKASADVQPQLIKHDSNENPFGPSPRAIQAMQSALAASNFYPDDDCAELRSRLATHHAVSTAQVLVTAGSTEMLALLCQTMLAPGLTTGTMLEAAAVDNFLAEKPGHVVVVLDEAYYDFALHFAALRKVEYSRSLEYLRRGASVIVLRTFSKAHGLAGLRVGYGLGPAELLAYCARLRNTFSVSSLAQAAALAALDDHNHIAQVVSNNTSQALVLTEGLSKLGYRVVPTSANFLYCDVGEEASGVAGRLRAEGISVRPLGAWGAPTCIRVTVGTPEQNELFLSAMRKIVALSQRPAPR